jgi:IS30 family transposase
MGQCYRQLTLEERRTVFHMKAAKASAHAIADRLGRHRSTIYRELARNTFQDADPYFNGYFPTVAHDAAARRRQRLGKLHRDQRLSTYVIERLKEAWSPEQISGYLRHHGGAGLRICHETIYQFVYSEAGRELGLFRHLPSSHRQRRVRYARKPRGVTIPPSNTIQKRPAHIGERTTFGHWEGDLLAFRKEFGKSNLTTLVERQSRYTVLIRNPDRNSTGVMTGVIQHLRSLPSPARQTITFDRGTEFARYSLLRQQLGIECYFCSPQAPWQKGSVENTNGRLRRFLPPDTDPSGLTPEMLGQICSRINNTPRKCLGFRTPQEVLTCHLQEATSSDPMER